MNRIRIKRKLGLGVLGATVSLSSVARAQTPVAPSSPVDAPPVASPSPVDAPPVAPPSAVDAPVVPAADAPAPAVAANEANAVRPETAAAEGAPLPAEGLPLPVYTPPAVVEEAKLSPVAAKGEGPTTLQNDEILYSGYLPGYRRFVALGSHPAQPAVGSLPGLLTPGYGAGMPPSEWTFSFAGFMSVSAQASVASRAEPEPGQSTTVTHVAPQTIDNYMYFTTTGAVPGSWVNLRFRYGTGRVAANFSVDTYNPTQPTTFYQMGSQWFINNAFLSYDAGPIGPLSFSIDVGRMGFAHGQLSRYGNGIYTNLVAGQMQGNGLRVQSFYTLNQDWRLALEGDVLASQDGTLPSNLVRSQENGWRRTLWAGSIMSGVHLGFDTGKSPRTEFRLRYLTNREWEDRLTDGTYDDPGTRPVNEKHLKNAKIGIYAADVKWLDDIYGVLGVGASYARADNVYALRGLVSYAGNGEEFTERYLGVDSGGTGGLFVAAANYSANLRPIAVKHWAWDGLAGPDVTVNVGGQFTRTSTDGGTFDGRVRYKFGGDFIVAPFKYFSVAVRGDHVVPDSSDSGQTFEVLAPRLQFKSDWFSRETLQLMYVKWFFGPRTRNEGTGERSQEQLDDQLFALNLNMWW